MLMTLAFAAFALSSKIDAAPRPGNDRAEPTSGTASIYVPGARTSAGRDLPLRFGRGPHLLIDDLFIDSSTNLRRVVNMPSRDPSLPNPLITGQVDGCFQPYMTVLRDPDAGRFRLWYGARTEDSNPSASRVAMMESNDGIHWRRPHRVLSTPPIQFGVSMIDRGAAATDRGSRYVLGWWHDGGLKLAGSPDGLSWKPILGPNGQEVLLRHNHDINSLFHDTARGRYVATISTYVEGPAWRGKRRVTMQAVSSDLLTWDAPHVILAPDDRLDAGETQFYAMDGFLIRGDL